MEIAQVTLGESFILTGSAKGEEGNGDNRRVGGVAVPANLCPHLSGGSGIRPNVHDSPPQVAPLEQPFGIFPVVHRLDTIPNFNVGHWCSAVVAPATLLPYYTPPLGEWSSVDRTGHTIQCLMETQTGKTKLMELNSFTPELPSVITGDPFGANVAK